MTDNELIKNLKQLKQIKPNQDWVSFSKNQILGQEEFVITESKNPSIISVFQTLFQKPAYATITAVMLLIVGMAGLFYLTEKETPVKIAETPEKIVYNEPEIEPEKEIILALDGLQKEINKVTEGLKKIEEPQKLLEARNVVVPFIEDAREMIAEAEKLEKDTKINKDKQVLGTVINVNESIDELESTADKMIAIEAKNLIQYLKTRTLTEIQREILEKAKQAYQDGDYNVALINAVFVNQLRER